MKKKIEIDKLPLIPGVENATIYEGSFSFSPNAVITVNDPELYKQSRLLGEYLEMAGHSCTVASAGPSRGTSIIALSLAGEGKEHEMGFPDESYTLAVGEESINLTAPTRAGIARGIQTLRQLAGSGDDLPALEIVDKPRLPWRGMHLDVSRHFFEKKEVLRFIDTIALFRFNKFHFHLTDDQGWRPEIRKYPRLTEVGSRRSGTLIGHYNDKPHRFDDTPYGGFYTRKDMEEIVEYARIREIDIIPEIDMPGHMQAAISAYPELGCTDMTLEPRCTWGISQHILNPEESTINFMKDVLDEIMDIFPYTFIHLGGDEAHKYEWEEQRRVQDRMAMLGLESEEELQSWFISRMGEHVRRRGRRMIGWDEILEGGLADGAIVMSWRSEEGGIEAARLGAPIINCPCEKTYFDYYQGPKDKEPLTIGGRLTLEQVYRFEPVPDEIPENKKYLVMGSQGQLWSEYMPDFSRVEYMAFPRALALAETLWCRPEEKDWEGFLSRLTAAESLLDGMEVNYRR
jgi:hexosaminidase